MLQGAKNDQSWLNPVFTLPSTNLVEIKSIRFSKAESFFTLESFLSAVSNVRLLHRPFWLIQALKLLFFYPIFSVETKKT